MNKVLVLTMENNIIKRITHRYIYSKIILRAGQKRNLKANHNRKNMYEARFSLQYEEATSSLFY